MKMDFKAFQDVCLGILAQSNNCQESQAQFKAAKTIPELVTAWVHYWGGVLHEVPEQVIRAFAELYPQFREEINRAGVYYNESPSSPEAPAQVPAIVLVGDGEQPFEVYDRHRVYVLGNAPVSCHDRCNVNIFSERASVDVYDACRCFCEAGNVRLHDRSSFTGTGDVETYDSATAYVSGGTVRDHGHMAINAYGNAKVYSFTHRFIHIEEEAELIIQPT